MKNNLQEVLGLTLNEARVFQALIKGISIEVSELKTHTKLPRTRIYEVLASLSAKNLVEKRSNGTGYRLIPPQESIPKLVDQIDREYQKQRDSVLEFGDYLGKIWNDAIASDMSPGVEVFSLEDAEPLFINHLKKVKERVLIAAGATKASMDMRKSGTTLASVYDSSLEVKYLISQKNVATRIRSGFNHFSPFQNMEIRIRSNQELKSSFVILDNVIYIFFFGGENILEPSALRTSSADLLHSFEWMFNKLWQDGVSH